MATTASAQNRFVGARPMRIATWIAIGAATALVAGLLYWLSPQWLPLLGVVAGQHQEEPAGEQVETPTPSTVTLSAEKAAASMIEVGPVQSREIAGERTVPAKVEYKPTEHLEVKAPAAGVVREVFVQAGERIAAGARLCTLTSSEIGLARDEVLAREAELVIANKELAFRSEVATNVAELVAQLESAPSLSQLETQFAKRRLGTHRETILGAYSKLKLAEAVIQQTSSLDGQGVISGRIREERQSALEVASAAFRTACEQALFEAQQQRDKAASTVAQDQRRQKVSQQTLASLLGPFAEQTTATDEDTLSEFTLCSPIAATVDERLITTADRVTLGQEIFVLGNSTTLWISAEVHERDWKLVNIQPGQSLTLTSPALPGQTFTAKVHHLGAAVSPETRAVPLVAEIDNTDGKFRPGMFAWVTIPYESADARLVVPAAAVVRHGEQPMVFLPAGERTYRRVNIQVGRETPEWIEVVAGLTAGQPVVTRGAFTLKSELLIEREE